MVDLQDQQKYGRNGERNGIKGYVILLRSLYNSVLSNRCFLLLFGVKETVVVVPKVWDNVGHDVLGPVMVLEVCHVGSFAGNV